MNSNIKARLDVILSHLEETMRPGAATVRELMDEHEALERSLEPTKRLVDDLQRKYDLLTGERFSDRSHAALRSRAEKAESGLEAALDKVEYLRRDWQAAIDEEQKAEAALANLQKEFDSQNAELAKHIIMYDDAMARAEKAESENTASIETADGLRGALAAEEITHQRTIAALERAEADLSECEATIERIENFWAIVMGKLLDIEGTPITEELLHQVCKEEGGE